MKDCLACTVVAAMIGAAVGGAIGGPTGAAIGAGLFAVVRDALSDKKKGCRDCGNNEVTEQ